MNARAKKGLNVIYCGLMGFNFGFVVALLFAQWTWLELRFNTGLAILAGIVIGLSIGLFHEIKRPLAIMWISLAAMFITELLIAKTEISSLMILTGYTFREGLLIPDLSLRVSNIVFSLIILWGILVAFLHQRRSCSESVTNKF